MLALISQPLFKIEFATVQRGRNNLTFSISLVAMPRQLRAVVYRLAMVPAIGLRMPPSGKLSPLFHPAQRVAPWGNAGAGAPPEVV